MKSSHIMWIVFIMIVWCCVWFIMIVVLLRPFFSFWKRWQSDMSSNYCEHVYARADDEFWCKILSLTLAYEYILLICSCFIYGESIYVLGRQDVNIYGFRGEAVGRGPQDPTCWKEKGMLGTYAMNRVAAGAHLPTSWLFEPAKRPDDRSHVGLPQNFDWIL